MHPRTAALLALALVLFTVSAPLARAQGEAAAPIFTLPLDAAAHGLGRASVALPSDLPEAFLMNPAQIGLRARHHSVAVSRFGSDWLRSFPGIHFAGMTAAVGFAPGGIDGATPRWSVGAAVSRSRLDLGRVSVTSPDGPDVLATYDAQESEEQYGIGACYTGPVTLAAGFSVQHITSDILPPPMGAPTATSFGYGFYLGVPLLGLGRELSAAPLTLPGRLTPQLDVSFGAARSHLGDATLVYALDPRPNPIPRTGVLAIGLTAALDWETGGVPIQAAAMRWTVEASDLLVRREAVRYDSAGAEINLPWRYLGGFGNVNVMDQLIGAHTSSHAERRKGWELTLLETLTVRAGTMDDEAGHVHVASSGFGFRLDGFFKAIRAGGASDGVLGFVARKMSLRYDHAIYRGNGQKTVLHHTTFDGLAVTYAI